MPRTKKCQCQELPADVKALQDTIVQLQSQIALLSEAEWECYKRRDDVHKRVDARLAADHLRGLVWADENNYPCLDEGSEKQINWATTLRRLIVEELRTLDDMIFVKECEAILRTRKDAKVWIDLRQDNPRGAWSNDIVSRMEYVIMEGRIDALDPVLAGYKKRKQTHQQRVQPQQTKVETQPLQPSQFCLVN